MISGPYTEATIRYEPNVATYTPVVKSSSILGVLQDVFPATYNLVVRANFESRYASAYPNTLFVSKSYRYNPRIPKYEAIRELRDRNVPRNIDDAALFSARNMRLKSDGYNDIVIDGTTANGLPILYSIKCSNGSIYVTV